MTKLIIRYTIWLSAFITPLSTAQQAAPAKTMEQVVQTVKKYCGACHATPSPNLMPKRSWPYAVDKMAEIAKNRFKKPFIPEESIRDIKAFYYGSSPAELPRLPYSDVRSDHLGFKTNTISKSNLPLVASIIAVELYGGGNEFLVSDAEHNTVSHLGLKDGQWTETVLADVEVPSRARTVDFDGDGDKDIIVASLGLIFPPQGKFAGRVYLLKQIKPGEFSKIVRMDNIGRVNDVRVLDIDGDKDLDVAIAVFGGDVNGALGWLENKNGKFYKRPFSEMGGALNVTPIDLNNDKLVDFVAYFAQEHEVMVGFVNKGKGRFEKVALFQANNPMLGVTSVEAVDLDSDGDTDLIFSNGDAHDIQFDPKPYHGVQWLENKGNLTFEYRDIGRFYGASNAIAGDIDGDGDMDIVASSWNNYWEDPKRKSLIWFENDGQQNFARRDILNHPISITAVALSDVTGDKRLDIIAGVFQIDALKRKVESASSEKAYQEPAPSPRMVVLENLNKNKE